MVTLGLRDPLMVARKTRNETRWLSLFVQRASAVIAVMPAVHTRRDIPTCRERVCYGALVQTRSVSARLATRVS